MENYQEVFRYTKEEKEKYFGKGEWIDEPDFVIFNYLGYRLEIVRNAQKEFNGAIFGGNLNGYIFLKREHPWYGKYIYGDNINVDIHGGLTFGQEIENEYVLGFDCAHSHDLIPSYEILSKTIKADLKEKDLENWEYLEKKSAEIRENALKTLGYNPLEPTYKNLSYVIEECKSLALQAKEAEENVKALT